MIDDLDLEFVVLLQQQFLSGGRASEVVRLLSERVPSTYEGGMMASEYLREAFAGSIFETKVIGAWDYFAGGVWTAEQVGVELDAMCLDWKLRRRFTET